MGRGTTEDWRTGSSSPSSLRRMKGALNVESGLADCCATTTTTTTGMPHECRAIRVFGHYGMTPGGQQPELSWKNAKNSKRLDNEVSSICLDRRRYHDVCHDRTAIHSVTDRILFPWRLCGDSKASGSGGCAISTSKRLGSKLVCRFAEALNLPPQGLCCRRSHEPI